MTEPTSVRELIAWLSELDPDAAVYMPGHEGGAHDVGRPERIFVVRDQCSDKWGWGPHDAWVHSDGAGEGAIPGFLMEARNERNQP